MRIVIALAVISSYLCGLGGARANAVTPKDFGAKGDVVKLADGAITRGGAGLTSASAHFSSSDVGKAIVVSGAGGAPDTSTCGDAHRYGTACALVTTIQKFNSATSVTLAEKAITTVSGALVYYGTDDSAGIKRCIRRGTLAGGRCTINDGVTFMVSNSSSTINFFGLNQNPAGGGTIDGTGTIIYAPQGILTVGINDRLFYIQSNSLGPFQIAGPADGTHPINQGDMSFTAFSASDAAMLRPNDWVVILERDSGAGDNVYVDGSRLPTSLGPP